MRSGADHGGMRVFPPPSVPYGATAVRPDWPDLPAELRSAISARLGSPVTWSTTATGGFTNGFAAVLDTAAGDKAFVKAARLVDQQHLCDWYAHEAAVVAALPAAVAAPAVRWTLTTAGYFAVCFEAVPGLVPSLPWSPSSLSVVLSAWASTASALAAPPVGLVEVGLPSLSDLLRADLSWWQEILAGRYPLPPAADVARDRIRELAALEAALPGLVSGSSALTHCDLRVDNVLVSASGQVWFCDWNWLCRGPAWFDTAGLLVSAYASGLDADGLFFAHPTAAGVPEDALDGTLAALSGYLLSRAAAGPTDASPHLRDHQRWSGEATLAWLAERRGWW
jgi:aminoglycoside phosphotransferase (APT) family kinase protein